MTASLQQTNDPLSLAAAAGWHPHKPSFAEIPEVRFQTGRRPVLYVMRKIDKAQALYRDCSPSESSAIETQDIMRHWPTR